MIKYGEAKHRQFAFGCILAACNTEFIRMPAGVEPGMTPAAEHDEIFFAVRPRLTSPYYVVDRQLISPAAVLASPAVPLQDFQLQLAVTLGVEAKPLSPATCAAPRPKALGPVTR
jgi:hypothetical protein